MKHSVMKRRVAKVPALGKWLRFTMPALFLATAGCANFNKDTQQLDDDFGNSAAQLQLNQASPVQITDLVGDEVGRFDANKGGRVLEAYRESYAGSKNDVSLKKEIKIKFE